MNADGELIKKKRREQNGIELLLNVNPGGVFLKQSKKLFRAKMGAKNPFQSN
jgi:hypothetical protein